MLEKYTDNFHNYYDNFPNGKLFRISFDSTLKMMRLLANRQEQFNEIREAFSVKNSSSFFAKQYGYQADDKKYAINKFGYFSPGLIFEILKIIRESYGTAHVVALSNNCLNYINDFLTPLKTVLNEKTFDISNVAEDTGRNNEIRRKTEDDIKRGIPECSCKKPFEFRKYQKEAIEALFFKGFGRGLIEIPTSGGKSFIIANFIWNYFKNIDRNAKVMIFVPNTQLVEQFYKDLIDYGINSKDLARFTGALKAKDRKINDVNTSRIIIANRQYAMRNMKDIPGIDILFCDEVHTCNAENTQQFIREVNAKVKVGCSGTIPKNKFDLWQLLGEFSRIVFKENVTHLQEQGFISKLKITTIEVFHRNVHADTNCLFSLNTSNKYFPSADGDSDIMFNDAFNQEVKFYADHAKELFSPIIEYLNTLNENILVLFDRIDTGKNLFDIAKIKATNKKSFYIDGQTDIEVREDVRQQFEKSGNNLLVGNVSILGTGINIKRLNHVCFLISTKSFSRVIQSIGRTLRLHSSKSEAHLVDVVMNFKYSQKHYKERLKMYSDIYNKTRPDEIIKITI